MLSSLHQKSFQELAFKTFKNRNVVVACVDRQHWANWSDRLNEIYFSTHFWAMMTTVNKVNNDKTKISDEFVLTICFTAQLDE